MRDLGFDCSHGVGFAKIGHGMRDSDLKRQWKAGFHENRMGIRD